MSATKKSLDELPTKSTEPEKAEPQPVVFDARDNSLDALQRIPLKVLMERFSTKKTPPKN
jgi:hypothetical protein